MMQLIHLSDTVVGIGVLNYAVPESLDNVMLKSVNATLFSAAVGNLDISLRIFSSNGDLKGAYAVPNVGAGHALISVCTFGNTGAYYLAQAAAVDAHHVPMQALTIEGGDRINLQGLVDVAGQWQDVNLWISSELQF